ncbi:unnamed protein product [Rotaria sp. Silwood2]|nr:unnamed protein product [Rotaria sp. Silwood2]
MFDFIPHSTELTKLVAAEITLVYHGIRHGHSYLSQACTADVSKKLFQDSTVGKNLTCGRTKACEIAANVLAPFMTSQITEMINKSGFYSLSFDASNKGHKKMFPFVVNYFTVRGIERSMIEVIELVNETADHIVASRREVLQMNNIDIQNMTSIGADNTNLLLKHINIRWLSLYPSIERLLKVFDPLSAYFLDLGDEDAFPCPPIISMFFTSTEAKYRKKLNQSFIDYVSSVIKYIEKYYDEQSELAELTAVFGIREIDQIKFHQIEECVVFLKLEVDHDKLFDELNILQSTFKEVDSYREPLSDQIRKYIGDDAHNFSGDIINDQNNESQDEEDLFHKPTIEIHEKENQIRSDQLWAYLLTESTTLCSEMTKVLVYVYSIPCSNAFAEGVFSHMKHAWTPSRNSMSTETIATELKIRLNSKIKCEDFYSFAQSQPELIKSAKSKQKYSYVKKRVLANANREDLL